MGRTALLYAAGAGFGAVVSLGSVAVLTRFLPPGAFGRLAVLIFAAEFLAVIYDLGILQGTMRLLFDPRAGDAERSGMAASQRQALPTATLVTVVAACVGTAIVWSVSGPLADLLLGDPHAGDLVRYAAGIGALTGILRLVANQLRYERRPVAYNFAYISRPLLGLAISVPLLAHAATVRSVMLGNLLGSAASILIAAALARRLFAARPSWATARELWRRGGAWAPVAFALWVMNTAGTFVLSVFASSHAVGLYRAAFSLGALASYFTGIFYMSWGPLTRSSLYQAARREIGVIALNRSFATLYLVLVSGVIFEIAILEDQLIRVAGQRYASASALIPLLALPFSLYGLFRVLYFTSSDPRRIKWFRGLSIFGSFVFIGIACATAGRLGAYGIVIAHCAPFLFGTLVMLWLGRSGGAPFPLEVRRSALAVASGAACLLADRLVVAFTGVPRLVPDAVAAVLLPILLLATGAIPRRWPAVAVSLLRRGRGGQATRADVAARLLELDPQEVVRLFEVVDASRLETVVDRTGISRPELLTWFVATLRMLAGGGPSSPDEEALGEYLLFSGPTAARDALARRLVAAEVEPLELERLSGTLAVLRKLPRRRWRDIALEAGRRPREAGRGPRVAERLPPPRPDTAPEPGPIAVADAAEELLQDPL